MWNPETKRISEMRDVIFLNRMSFADKWFENDMEHPKVSIEIKKQSIVETEIPDAEDMIAKGIEGTGKSVRFKTEMKEVPSAPDPSNYD